MLTATDYYPFGIAILALSPVKKYNKGLELLPEIENKSQGKMKALVQFQKHAGIFGDDFVSKRIHANVYFGKEKEEVSFGLSGDGNSIAAYTVFNNKRADAVVRAGNQFISIPKNRETLLKLCRKGLTTEKATSADKIELQKMIKILENGKKHKTRVQDMLPSIKLIKIDKMEENQILKFLLEGCVGGYSLNTLFDFNLENWDKSMLEYPNGVPRNHQGLLDDLFFNIGVFEDGRIQYMVMHIDDQNIVKKIRFNKKEIPLKRVLLNDIVEFLNRNKIEWRFTDIFEKVLILHIIQSNVELVFSYDDDDDDDINLILIQTPPKKDIRD